MNHYSKLTFVVGFCLSSFCFSDIQSPEVSSVNSKIVAHAELDNKVIGYKYNLWSIKATSLCDEKSYRFTGRIFLDKRKSYKSSFDKSEHTFMYKFEFQDGDIHYFRGNDEFSEVVKHSNIKDYYIALKFDRDWVHHTYEDIVKYQNISSGNEVGCPTCNFSKRIYTKEKDWMFTLIYEIRPIYKDAQSPESNTIEKEIVKNETSNQLIVSTEEVASSEEALISTNNANSIVNSNSISYHVLFKVLDHPNEEFSELKDLGPIYKETFDENGTTRYLIGNETSYREIVRLANQINELGFKECKIAKYRKGVLKSYLNI